MNLYPLFDEVYMKKLILFLLLSFHYLNACDKIYNMIKISHIFDYILRRVEKDPFDFTAKEVRNAIFLFNKEYYEACEKCQMLAERNYISDLDKLIAHLTFYK